MIIFLSIVIIAIVGIVIYNKRQKKNEPPTFSGEPTTYTNCQEVTFDAKYNFDITATWEDCFDGKKMSKVVPQGTTLKVCCKKNSANGGPFQIGKDC